MVRKRNKRARTVMKITPNSEYLETIPVREAIEEIWRGKAVSLEDIPDEFYFGPPDEKGLRWAMPIPATIMLTRAVVKPQRKQDDVMAARKQILNRDNWTCGYCGSPGATTIDHIHPQSRGGENTWFNLITACTTCNQLKDDMSLAEFEKEFGLKLLWEPKAPEKNQVSKEQMLVWQKISDGVIDIPDEL